MRFYIYKTADEIYNHILDNNTIEGKRLILPTGKTPIGLYQEMVRRKIDFTDCVTFNLDEYYPCDKTNPASYYTYMWHHLFQHINIQGENINLFDGGTAEPEKECMAYSQKLKDKPADIAFLGIGTNGHIAFNEPSKHIIHNIRYTRCVNLLQETIRTNKCSFNQALTLGLNEITSSKKIIIMAIGESKADIMYDLINMHCVRYVDRALPASYLFHHNNVDMYIDESAFGKILHRLNKTFRTFNKILIMSPHPDDDVIGMGATIKKMRDENKDVTVLFQTSGARGGNVLIRQSEARAALALVGVVDEEQIIFGNTPFYNDAHGSDVRGADVRGADMRGANAIDIDYTMKLISFINPDVIFFAGDVCDPHKTHLKCYKIIQACLRQFAGIETYNYYSAWSEPSHYDLKEYFTGEVMEIKKNAIKAHASQLNPPFPGTLAGEFYDIIAKRNAANANANGNANASGYYAEGFTRYI